VFTGLGTLVRLAKNTFDFPVERMAHKLMVRGEPKGTKGNRDAFRDACSGQNWSKLVKGAADERTLLCQPPSPTSAAKAMEVRKALRRSGKHYGGHAQG